MKQITMHVLVEMSIILFALLIPYLVVLAVSPFVFFITLEFPELNPLEWEQAERFVMVMVSAWAYVIIKIKI